MRRLFITIIAIAALTAASAQGIIRPKTSGAAVKKKPATTVRHKKPQRTPSPKERFDMDAHRKRLVNKLLGDMVYVKGGTFTAGCDTARYKEREREITLDSYYICKYELSEALWDAFMNDNWWDGTYEYYTKNPMGTNPMGTDNDRSGISCKEIQTFLERLNAYCGQEFRLPTEAEWEYAAIEGKPKAPYRFSGSNNANEVAVYKENPEEKEKKSYHMGCKKPNGLGLYDMSGGLAEMCYNPYNTYSPDRPVTPNGKKDYKCPPGEHTHVTKGGHYQSLVHELYPWARGLWISDGYGAWYVTIRLVATEIRK